MEKSRFRKTVDLIKRRAIRLLLFIFPPVTLNNLEAWADWDDWDDRDDFWFGVSAIFYVFLDPLFMYVPLINEETKCVMLDNRLKIAAIILRSFGDVRYLIRTYYRIKMGWRKFNSLKIINTTLGPVAFENYDRQYSDFLKIIAKNVANDAVCILPVPQVVILIFLPKMRGSRSLKTMKFLNSLILLQYLSRLHPIFKISMQDNKNTLALFKIKRARNLLKSNAQSFINTTWFGIAFNITCSFASNLNTSTYGWENLFVVVISISGLVLFIYFLGHKLETYMHATDRSKSIKRKLKLIYEPKIQCLLADYDLPSAMSQEIKMAVEQILEKDEDFILENMNSILSTNLPEQPYFKNHLDLEIKCELFLYKLKKVEALKDKDEKVLTTICKHLEPMIYMEESYIIRQGEPLAMMFFVTLGKVLTYATNNVGSSCSSDIMQLNEKEEDSLYGQELLTWAELSSSKLSSLPISAINVKSLMKVEVFALKASDLLYIVSNFPSHFNTEIVCGN